MAASDQLILLVSSVPRLRRSRMTCSHWILLELTSVPTWSIRSFPQNVIIRGMDPFNILIIIGVVVAAIIAFVFLLFIFRYLNLWLQAFLSNAYVGFGELIGMQLAEGEPAGDRALPHPGG